MHHLLRRATLTAASSGLVLLMAAGPAAAHISVNPKTAEAGSYATLSFKVPNERPNAATVKVELALPADQPLASVSVRPLPGWTVKTEKKTLPQPLKHGDREITSAVSRIVWSGGKVRPGEFQEFEISAGPLPEHADRMVFKALQTYDNGEVVRWIETAAEGEEEPEHPAPVLTLSPATDDDASARSDTAAATPGSATADAKASVAAEQAGTQDGSARLLGAAGLAAGVAGVLVGITARRRAGQASGRGRS